MPLPDQDHEGCLLTGMNESLRERIMGKLDLVLEELKSAVSADEFFWSSPMLSPSNYDDEQLELREALQQCKVFVQMAIPEEEKNEGSLMGTTDVGRWHFLPGLREAVGIRVAVTPESRSMSCFSLPEDCNAEIPMTSNLSVCCNSTLTTKDQSALPLVIADSNGKKKDVQDGLHLRQSIIDMASGLNKFSQACRSLGDVNNMGGIALARSTDLIKTTYQDMQAMKQQDLKSLVNAFEFVLDNPEDSYELNDDEEEADDVSFDGSCSIASCSDYKNVNYPIVHATGTSKGAAGVTGCFACSVVGGSDMSFHSNLSSLHPSIAEEDEEDEDTNTDELFEYDDLRRQTASSDDHDGIANSREVNNSRDAPPETVFQSGNPVGKRVDAIACLRNKYIFPVYCVLWNVNLKL